MGILQQLLSELKDSDLTHQVRVICDQIIKEEESSIQYPELNPKGPRVFISLDVPGRNDKEIGFLTMEREDEEVYIAIYSTLEKHRISKDPETMVPPRRRKVWVIGENKAEKILTQFAKKLKMLRG
jgi:hypothetical protein